MAYFLISFEKTRELKVFLLTLMARGSSALGSILFITIVANLFGVSVVGSFAIAQSILLMLSTVARFGMSGALMKYVGQDPFSSIVLGHFLLACMLSFGGGVALGVGLYFSRNLIGEVFDEEVLSDIMIGIAVSLPPLALSFIFSGYFKGLKKPALASFLENGAIAFVASIFVISISFLDYHTKTSYVVGGAYAVAAWVVMLFGLSKVWGSIKNRILDDVTVGFNVSKNFLIDSCSYLCINLAQIIQSVATIWVAGYLLGSEDVGMLKVAQQLAMVVGIFFLVIEAIYPPKFANLFYRRSIEELKKVSCHAALLGGLVSLPFAVLLFSFPHFFLNLFGESFLEADLLLQLMLISQVVNVLSGPSGSLLSMVGEERLMRNIVVLVNLAGVVIYSFMTISYGVTGAAMGISLMLISQNVISSIFVKKKLGFWLFPRK